MGRKNIRMMRRERKLKIYRKGKGMQIRKNLKREETQADSKDSSSKGA